LTTRGRWWWIVGAIIILTAVVGKTWAPVASFPDFLVALSILWTLCTACWLSFRVWRWMTYRVGVRLFVTFLMVGVLPVLFAITFGMAGLYILMGQYTSVRLGSELRRVSWELAHQCDSVLQRAELQGVDSAAALLEEFAAASHEPLPRVIWQARFGDRSIRLEGGEDLPEMDWLTGNERDLTARYGDRPFDVVSSASAAGDRVTALIPLDEASSRAISGAWWFDVAFLIENSGGENENAEEPENAIEISTARSGTTKFTVSGREVAGNDLWPEWSEKGTSVLDRPLVIWFRVVPDMVDLATGEPLEGASLLALLRTSPVKVWEDFTLSRYELARELWGVLAGLAAFFLVGYGMALAAAAGVVFSIARSTSRLTQGARQVERGNLDHRVPVKRRDQLGDLARSFNHMTDSVQSMLVDVAEKERLARELELAREIQQSLLPARRLELGPLLVRATFQPAAEVGGDYFDVFPVADDRLIVTIGDVAGHGLSTGLLMASLKSSVAALVHEGYSGTKLAEKVNGLLMQHGEARKMVTMAVIEIDPLRGRLLVANAGHPPPYLISGDDGPKEILASALPMGNRLCRPASTQCDFPNGSRLLLYSDGLVEAAAADGEPFGYHRLVRVLEESTGRDGDALIASTLKALADYTEGVPLADDLTLLVIERCD
jgi:HAMP domain-containing protein